MVRIYKSDVDMSSGEYKDKQGGGAGLPVTKGEVKDGKKMLPNGMSRVHRVYTEEEIAQGKSTRWTELEIHGRVRNLSPSLWNIQHLSALFLNGNQLQRLPPEISQLNHLTMLDLSNNKLRSLPAELGDMITLCHLYLNNNLLRVLPYELGKLFRVQTLGLQGNPLSPEISKIYHESNGSQRILQFLLDHLTNFIKPVCIGPLTLFFEIGKEKKKIVIFEQEQTCYKMMIEVVVN
ncbi:unnamed protein product [Caenorhabditis angaria]|uniref:Uncharacterized protein n=1 Tax=Caenorhabditis angaria TaxID=860376 RepID=A0A9P1N4A3_9PELO|nr:unnamed protein product [Caenorhabditis angaria]